MLASLVGYLGDFDRAEEAVQEAFALAAQRWPERGTADNPGAWLTTTARNRAIDRIRRDRTLAEKIHSCSGGCMPMPGIWSLFWTHPVSFEVTLSLAKAANSVPSLGGLLRIIALMRAISF